MINPALHYELASVRQGNVIARSNNQQFATRQLCKQRQVRAYPQIGAIATYDYTMWSGIGTHGILDGRERSIAGCVVGNDYFQRLVRLVKRGANGLCNKPLLVIRNQ